MAAVLSWQYREFGGFGGLAEPLFFCWGDQDEN